TLEKPVARAALKIRNGSWQQIVGRFPDRLAPLKANIDLSPPNPNSMEDWASAASTQSFPVRAQEAAVEVAVREIERIRAGHLPTVNLVGAASRNSTSVSTTAVNNVPADANNRSI